MVIDVQKKRLKELFQRSVSFSFEVLLAFIFVLCYTVDEKKHGNVFVFGTIL